MAVCEQKIARKVENEKPGTALAKIILGQIDRRDPQSAFGVVSAISKIAHENPKMTMACLRNIIFDSMPAALEEYTFYLKNT